MNQSLYWLKDELYGRFRDLVLEQSGLHFPAKKRRELELALRKALAGLPADVPPHLQEPEGYYRYLRFAASAPARQEMARFINLLTIGETHFFRDSAQFDALTTQVLPSLIARKREMAAALSRSGETAVRPHLRIWCAGCATGEEAYSLAILLRELIPDYQQWRILIQATDINELSLAQARQAIYSDWSFRESRAQRLRPLYFTPHSAGYQLRDDIRHMVTFAHHNLIRDAFPAVANNTISMDLILCRNVTIYFAPETTRHIVGQFHHALVEGGWLIVGHSEPSLSIFSEFTGHIIEGTLLYQKLTPHTAHRYTAPVLKPEAETVTAENVLETAQLLLSHGRTDTAINLLEKAVAENAQLASAHTLLARAYANLGQWEQSRLWCEKAMAIDPLLPEVYDLLAMVEEQNGRLQPAIENLKKLIYLDPARPLAHFNLAVLYKKRSQVDLAQRSLKNTLSRIQALPPENIIPNSGHTSVQRLSEAAQQLLAELENTG